MKAAVKEATKKAEQKETRNSVDASKKSTEKDSTPGITVRQVANPASYAGWVTRVLFVGGHGALAAALRGGVFFGPVPAEAVVEAIEELDVPFPRRAEAPAPGDVVVDTDAWNLPDPAGLCLEEVRELRSVIEQRVASLPQ